MNIMNSYDKAILDLKSELISMSERVKLLLKITMEALLDQNLTKAQGIIALEDEVDELDYQIELGALEIISLQQPMDDDLRSLATVMRISKDLERIGDLAINIAEITMNIALKGKYFKELIDIPKMSHLVINMLELSLKAYIEKDIDLAHEVNKSDEAVDNIYKELYFELIEYMKKESTYVEQATYLILVARFLERIGDHTVNIAEMTVYEVQGTRRPFI